MHESDALLAQAHDRRPAAKWADLQIDAKTTLQIAIDRLRELMSGHKDTPNYVWDLKIALERKAVILTNIGDIAGAKAVEAEIRTLTKQNSDLRRTWQKDADDVQAQGRKHEAQGMKNLRSTITKERSMSSSRRQKAC